jgi:hypothetical protein
MHLNHDKYWLTTDELITLGILNYNDSQQFFDFEKKLDFLFIHSIFNRINLGIKFNFIIFKDATASALQLLTLVLNIKDKNLTEIFNLNSKTT